MSKREKHIKWINDMGKEAGDFLTAERQRLEAMTDEQYEDIVTAAEDKHEERRRHP